MNWLAVILLLSAVVPDSGKKNHGADLAHRNADNQTAQAPLFVNQVSQSTSNEKTAYKEPPHWYASPEWWLVILGFPILAFIGWQTKETRKAAEATRDAAKAALLQANHTVTSERAWMIAEAGDAGMPPEIEGATGIRWTEFSVRFVNKGKTPAFLLEAGYCGKVLPHGENLPAFPPPFGEKEIFKWEGKGLPLLPGADVHKSHLGTWAVDPVKITHGFDVLWVYGYIKYGDAFGFVRETWYCYRWVHEIERYQVSGFIAGGPESYNHAT